MAIPQRPSVFVSYSHRDGIWLEKLKPHLGSLARERGFDINFWDDIKIRPGVAWESELLDALGSARVAILLISSHFLNSEYIGGRELPPLLEAAAEGRATVLPVIVSPCRYVHHARLSKVQSVNPPNQPLQGMSAVRRETLFLRLTEYVDDALSGAQPAPAVAEPATTAPAPAMPAQTAAAADSDAADPVHAVDAIERVEAADAVPVTVAVPEPFAKLPKLAAQPRTLPPVDFDDDWRRVVIQTLADGSLLFQTIAGDERLEGRVAPPQQRLVDRLVEACVRGGSFDRLAAAMLFELLLPVDVKGRLFDGPGVLLTLDAATARTPWELLIDHGMVGGVPGTAPCAALPESRATNADTLNFILRMARPNGPRYDTSMARNPSRGGVTRQHDAVQSADNERSTTRRSAFRKSVCSSHRPVWVVCRPTRTTAERHQILVALALRNRRLVTGCFRCIAAAHMASLSVG